MAWLALAAVIALFLPAGGRAQTLSRIVSLRGELSVQRARQPLRALKLHDAVEAGDELIAGQDCEAVIQTADGASVRIFPDSRVVFSEHSPDIQEFLHLFLGSIKVHIEKLSGRPNPHKMTTPTAVIAVRGTTFSVFVDEMDATLVAVDEGIVSVANRRSPGEEVLVHGGQRTWVRRDQPPSRAQRFRGRSERADLIPARGPASGMGMPPAGMRGEMDSMPGAGAHGTGGMGGMPGRPGPPH